MNVEKQSDLSKQKHSYMPIVSPPVDAPLDNSEEHFPKYEVRSARKTSRSTSSLIIEI